MKLSTVENYFYMRNTIRRLNKKVYPELSEVGVNILFSIYTLDLIGQLCSKKALYDFMSKNYHTPNKTKFFALIRNFLRDGIIIETKTNRYNIVSLSIQGKVILHNINEKLQTEKLNQV